MGSDEDLDEESPDQPPQEESEHPPDGNQARPAAEAGGEPAASEESPTTESPAPAAEPRVNLVPPAAARVAATQAALTTQIRDTTKWLIGAMGAVAAVVLAGIHLSTIASAHGGRLWVGIAMVVITLLAVLGAVWMASLVLIPSSLTIGSLCQNEFVATRKELSTDPLLKDIDVCGLPDARKKTVQKVNDQERKFDHAYESNSRLKAVHQDRLLRARENAAAVDRTVEVVEALGWYYETRRLFKRALRALAGAAVVVIVCALVFVGFAGRVSHPPSAAPSCRYAAGTWSADPGLTDPAACPFDGEPVIVMFSPPGKQAYEKEASALTGSTCRIKEGVNSLGDVVDTQPVTVILLEVNGSEKGPCITAQGFVFAKDFGTIAKYPFTSP